MSNQRPDYEDCFKSAFGLTIVEIEGANGVSVECLFNALRNNSGDFRKQSKALIECLGSSGWKWRVYDGPLTKENEYKKMAEAMAARIETLAHSLHRREQLFEVVERRPYWEFRAGASEHTPQKCLAMDGVVKHYQDSIWKTHLPPCESPHCRCQVFSLSERDLARRVKKA